jgi:cysteine desulfurase
VRETLDAGRCVPHTLHLLCAGLEGQTLVLRLDEAGFCVSAGSACGSKSLDPSHVLTAMGVPRDDAFGSLRVSLGAETTGAEVDALAAALKEILA